MTTDTNPLKTRLMEDMKTLMKNKEQKKLGYLRMILSEVKNAEINNRETFKPEMALQAVVAYQKKLKKSLSEFSAFPEKIAELEEEIAFCQQYLPTELSDDEVLNILKKIVNASQDKSFGVLMKLAMQELSGKANGQKIQSILKSLVTP